MATAFTRRVPVDWPFSRRVTSRRRTTKSFASVLTLTSWQSSVRRRREIERILFGASYKGVTDFVTKYLWPAPARVATRWCAERAIRPNTVTALSAACVVAAYLCFARGYFALGVVFAWSMTFLDTVDGKLARVTLTSSKFGNVFDHGVDLIHPPFWYFAWWQGLGDSADAVLYAALWVNLVGYVVGRLMEGFFLAAYKIEIHAWRPIDSYFRLITARRNPNLAILTRGARVRRAGGRLRRRRGLDDSFDGLPRRADRAGDSRQRGRVAPRSWLAERA